MQELFRFYAIRAADAAVNEAVPLETNSEFQLALRITGPDPAVISSQCKALLDEHDTEVARELAHFGHGMHAFKRRIDALEPCEREASVDEWVREDFGQSLADLAERLSAKQDMLKDVLVALRVGEIASRATRRVGHIPATIATSTIARRVTSAPSETATTATRVAAREERRVGAEVMRHLRLRTALLRAAQEPQTVAYMKRAPTMSITYDNVDRLITILNNIDLTPPPDQAQQQRAALQDLTALIIDVRQASPGGLAIDPPTPLPTDAIEVPRRVVLHPDLATTLAGKYAELLQRLGDLPGPTIPTDLSGGYVDLHAKLEGKAFAIEQLLDQAPAAPTGSSPAATSPMIGGHMQLAGVADVHVVLNHVVDYKRAEIAQIENILLGEHRERTFRTLLRSEQATENTTEATTTQEREVKTEDRSNLKAETQSTLKEVLDLKAGVDVQYKQGDSLKLGINASIGYSRTKEETNKVASEFAKEVTNRAAQKVVDLARQSLETKRLNETEETVKHSFDNAGAIGTANVSGMYQWMEKVIENVHLTVGGPAAIFDGVVLQPARRILSAPAASDNALGSMIPPPPLDVNPSDIHPWNYMSLAAKFGGLNVLPPPPFTTNASYASSAANNTPYGAAQDVALPEDAHAAWSVVIWDAEDKKDDKPDWASAVGSLGTNRLSLQR